MSATHALPPPATSRNSDEDTSHHTPVLSGASEPAIEWNDIEFKISTQNFGRTLLSRFNQRVRGKHDGDEPPRSRELSHMSHSIANLNDVVAVDAPAGDGKDAQPPPKFRTLLHRTSGIMPKAKFIAIMGSSGAGKTTFLNTLSGQLKVSSIRAQKTGVVRVNGKRLTKQVFQDHCAYVQQFDALTPLLTVEETVLFHANLRLPATMSWNEKRERANDVIRKLGLEHVRHSRIGDEYVRGISGGERRRVSIAIEMVSGPEVLFLDEPTSGLDAKTSLNLATTLSELAHEHNLTVVCTIHQPRSQIFEKFDCLMLLARGHIVYYGEANRAIDHFTSLGFPCPTHENPADFFIDLLTLDSNSEESAAQSNERVEQIIAASKINAGSMVARGEAEEERKRRLTLNRQSQAQLDRPRGFLSRRSSRGAFWLMQVLWLWLRATLCIVRNPAAAFSRFAPVVSGLVIALLWMQMDSDQTTISDRQSLLFLSVVSVNFPEAFANLVLYPMERAIYQRERENRVYSASAYWVATQLAHLPLQILAPLPFLILVYWVSGLQTGFQHFVVYVVTVELTSFCANSVGLFMGAAMPAQLASIATPSAMVLLFLVGGFFLYPDNMPNWLYWTRYLSWFTYANDALVVNEFSGKSFYCKPDQFQVLSVNATCAGTMEVVSNTTSICPTTNGQSVIDFRSSDKLPIFGNVLILFGFVVLFRFLLYFPLRYAKPKA